MVQNGRSRTTFFLKKKAINWLGFEKNLHNSTQTYTMHMIYVSEDRKTFFIYAMLYAELYESINYVIIWPAISLVSIKLK